MSSRAVLLPTPGDPFLMKYWIDNFREKYKKYVDKLYVCINTSIERPVVKYIQDMLDSVGASYMYLDHQIEHGDAINRLLEMCQEEYIVLVEDDSFVIKGEKVAECFERLENDECDVVAGKRGSCAMEILKRASEVWGINYEGYGDQGCNFWPNMFFCKKEILLKTDRNFGARMWYKGEKIEPLNYITQGDCATDTFVNTSLQLRAMGLRFHIENHIMLLPMI